MAFNMVGRLHDAQPMYFKEPVEEEGEDPVAAYRTNTFQVIRSAFDLAHSDDGQLKVNVDNVCPLLRSFGLNPKDDLVMDMVRDACMESTGDIEPQRFDEVVNTLVKRLDDDLWTKRLEEKEHLRHEHEAKKARLEAEKLRKADERRKAGFNEEDEDAKEGEWEQYEREKLEESEKKKQEHKCDELYDNLKMAFRFIDADGDGVITTKDLYTLMMGLGEMMNDDDLFGMFSMADIDCDGKVTFDDFKNFLVPGGAKEDSAEETPEQTESKQNQDSTTSDTEIDASKQLVQDDVITTEVTTNKPEASVTPEVNSQLPEVTSNSAEVSQNNAEEVKRDPPKNRRFSILRGYNNVSTKLSQQALKPEPEEIEPTPQEAPPFIQVTPSTESLSITTPTIETTPKVELITDEASKDEVGTDCVDGFNHLIAIREEDEHSNYEFQNPDDNIDGEVAKITASSVSAALENKRKHLNRQGSSASLKTRPNSALTTESICDSGIDTMDNLYGSEIREQPDVFDISDEEMVGDGHNNTPCGSFVRPNSKSSHDGVYEMNEDDEDMVEARLVHESLSRVSSPGLCDLNDIESQKLLSIEVRKKSSSNDSGIAIERLDIKEDEPTDEKIGKNSEERLARAKQLQSLISSRSLTSPRTTCYTSRTSPKVDRADLPAPSCSQIDINLTCEAPPKADVRSRRLRRIQSARTPRTVYATEKPDQTMTVVEVGDGINEQAPGHVDLPRFPSRPLIRPSSQRRPISARVPVKGRIDIASLSVDVRPVETHRRVQSAVPFARTVSAPQILVRARRRPMTATAKLSYTGSRRMEEAFSKLPNGDEAKVIHPRVEQEYPNKAVLTTLHHGFKTFWPMGRSVNVIKDKKPFQAFELNSYSRSIERSAVPFKGVSTISASADKMGAAGPVDERVFKMTNQHTKHIHLDLDVKELPRPRVRSAFVAGRRTPNIVK